MFGYLKTDLPYVYMKDTVLYKAIYCGLCKSIGKTCGQRARLVLNYDLTFLSLIAHNLLDKDVKIEKERCVIHHIRKRPIAKPTDLSERNVILAYYKLLDGIIDKEGGKLKKAFLKKAYKKAKKLETKLDEIVKRQYDELLKYEKTGGDSIDVSADSFGNMMKEISKELLGESATVIVERLFYAIGKWIYLIDALDDFDKDKKKKCFNVFVNMFKDACDKETLVKNHEKELSSVFGGVACEIAELSENLEYKFNADLIKNVLTRGIFAETKRIMENKKCKNTTKF